MQKNGQPLVKYTYDAAGNRVSKSALQGSEWFTTYYIRDASGNVMATYEKLGTGALKLAEVPLYGSDRLGLYKPYLTIPATEPTTEDFGTFIYVKADLSVPGYVSKSYKVKEDKTLTLSPGFGYTAAIVGQEFYATMGSTFLASRLLGKKSYELNDHLGNVHRRFEAGPGYQRRW